MEDGTIYVSSDDGYVLPHFGGEAALPSCVLRINPDEETFDLMSYFTCACSRFWRLDLHAQSVEPWDLRTD